MRIVIVLLLTLSANANAVTLLCIGEQAAEIPNTPDGIVLESKGYANNQKYLVDEKGVRLFGQDGPALLDACEIDAEGWPFLCRHTASPMLGLFAVDKNNMFTLFAVTARGDTFSHYIVKGKCSAL